MWKAEKKTTVGYKMAQIAEKLKCFFFLQNIKKVNEKLEK